MNDILFNVSNLIILFTLLLIMSCVVPMYPHYQSASVKVHYVVVFSIRKNENES